MNKLIEAILDVYGQVGDFHITPFDGATSIFDADAQAEEVVKVYTEALLTEARAEIERLREALGMFDDLIKHQYSGSREAMSDMAYAAQNAARVLKRGAWAELGDTK